MFANLKSLSLMCNKELKNFEKNLREYGNKMTASKGKSGDFLQRVGVTTRSGKLSKNYIFRSILGHRFR